MASQSRPTLKPAAARRSQGLAMRAFPPRLNRAFGLMALVIASYLLALGLCLAFWFLVLS